MIYDVNTQNLKLIPSIKRNVDEPEDQQESVYSLKINPSRSLLATGAYNSKEIGVYSLPSLKPIVLAGV